MTDIQSSLILYQTPDGQTRVEVKLEDETVWLTQAQMAEIFDTTKQNISTHFKNIFAEGELNEKSVVKDSLTTASDWKKYIVQYYNLDAIISLGYRVNSRRWTAFRIWATERLKEYIIKGFTLDDVRLKEGGYKNHYFEELFERIRDIRSSEQNFYYKVKEIYKLSVDYDPDEEMTVKFFKEIQNKFHWAIHGHTAAEIVHDRADADKPWMWLTTWKNQKDGWKIRKTDVSIAKNYLYERELKKLNLLVEQFLAFAETQAMSMKEMYMRNWIKKLGEILTMNDMDILADAGKISHDRAKLKAEKEYAKYKKNMALEEAKNIELLATSLKKLKTSTK